MNPDPAIASDAVPVAGVNDAISRLPPVRLTEADPEPSCKLIESRCSVNSCPLIVAVVYLIINLVIDISYALLDPRVVR